MPMHEHSHALCYCEIIEGQHKECLYAVE